MSDSYLTEDELRTLRTLSYEPGLRRMELKERGCKSIVDLMMMAMISERDSKYFVTRKGRDALLRVAFKDEE